MIETKKSFCRACHVYCGMEVDIEDNRVVAVRGDPDNAVTQGYTCMKGRAEVERIYHPDRLLAVVVRQVPFAELGQELSYFGYPERSTLRVTFVLKIHILRLQVKQHQEMASP